MKVEKNISEVKIFLNVVVRNGNDYASYGNTDKSFVNADVRNGNEDVRNGNEDVRNGNEDVRNGNNYERNGNEDERNGNAVVRNGNEVERNENESVKSGNTVVIKHKKIGIKADFLIYWMISLFQAVWTHDINGIFVSSIFLFFPNSDAFGSHNFYSLIFQSCSALCDWC